MEVSNPTTKMLEAEIKRVHEEQRKPLDLSNGRTKALASGAKVRHIHHHRSEAKNGRGAQGVRRDENEGCVVLPRHVYNEDPHVKNRREKCEARILFEDGDMPVDGEDFVRQAIPPITHAHSRDKEELLPWGWQVNQLQIFIKSDLSPWVTQQILFLLSGYVKSTPLFSRVVPREADTTNDEGVISYNQLMEATRPGAIHL